MIFRIEKFRLNAGVPYLYFKFCAADRLRGYWLWLEMAVSNKWRPVGNYYEMNSRVNCQVNDMNDKATKGKGRPSSWFEKGTTIEKESM